MTNLRTMQSIIDTADSVVDRMGVGVSEIRPPGTFWAPSFAARVGSDRRGDPCEALSQEDLRDLVVERIEESELLDEEFQQVTSWHPELRPRALLGILACSYAAQVYDSGEISELCEHGSSFAVFCGGRAPKPADLMRFRRTNREFLRKFLAGVFSAAVRRENPFISGSDAREMEARMLEKAGKRLDIARHLDTDHE